MPRRLIRRDELQLRVPYSMTHIWRLEQMPEDEDPFPSRIVIGEGRVAWDSDAVDAWIDRRIRASAGKKIRSPRKAVAEESR
jgi:predicted DNA-binding transcriptional regulator AlpA